MHAWSGKCFETNLSGSMLSKCSLRFCFSLPCDCSLSWIHSEFVVNNIVSLPIARSFLLWLLASLHMTRWRFGFGYHLDRNLNQYLLDKSPADQVSITTIQCSTSNFSLLWDFKIFDAQVKGFLCVVDLIFKMIVERNLDWNHYWNQN